MAEEKQSEEERPDGTGQDAAEPPPRARRILAEEAEPGDIVRDRDGLIDPFEVTKVRLDGGWMFIFGGPQPWSLPRRERIWRLPDEEAGAECSEGTTGSADR